MTGVLPAMLSALPALAGRPAQRRGPTASPEPAIWRVGEQIRFCCRWAPKSCPCGRRQNRALDLFEKRTVLFVYNTPESVNSLASMSIRRCDLDAGSGCGGFGATCTSRSRNRPADIPAIGPATASRQPLRAPSVVVGIRFMTFRPCLDRTFRFCGGLDTRNVESFGNAKTGGPVTVR